MLENQDEDLKILAVSQAESLLSLPAVITTNPGLPASSILEWQATVTAAEVCYFRPKALTIGILKNGNTVAYAMTCGKTLYNTLKCVAENKIGSCTKG